MCRNRNIHIYSISFVSHCYSDNVSYIIKLLASLSVRSRLYEHNYFFDCDEFWESCEELKNKKKHFRSAVGADGRTHVGTRRADIVACSSVLSLEFSRHIKKRQNGRLYETGRVRAATTGTQGDLRVVSVDTAYVTARQIAVTWLPWLLYLVATDTRLARQIAVTALPAA